MVSWINCGDKSSSTETVGEFVFVDETSQREIKKG